MSDTPDFQINPVVYQIRIEGHLRVSVDRLV